MLCSIARQALPRGSAYRFKASNEDDFKFHAVAGTLGRQHFAACRISASAKLTSAHRATKCRCRPIVALLTTMTTVSLPSDTGAISTPVRHQGRTPESVRTQSTDRLSAGAEIKSASFLSNRCDAIRTRSAFSSPCPVGCPKPLGLGPRGVPGHVNDVTRTLYIYVNKLATTQKKPLKPYSYKSQPLLECVQIAKKMTKTLDKSPVLDKKPVLVTGEVLDKYPVLVTGVLLDKKAALDKRPVLVTGVLLDKNPVLDKFPVLVTG